MVLIENFSKDLYKSFQAKLNPDPKNLGFDEICPTAAMMAFQLNVAAWQLYVNTTGIYSSNHLLTYHRRILISASPHPKVPRWPLKRAQPAFSNSEESKCASGLRLTMRPAYHQRLLPTELIMRDLQNPDLHRHRKDDDDEDSKLWSLIVATSPRLSITPFSSSSSEPEAFLMTGTPEFECQPDLRPTRQALIFQSRLRSRIIYQGKGNSFLLSSIVITIQMLSANRFNNHKAAPPGRSLLHNRSSSRVHPEANLPSSDNLDSKPFADPDNWLFRAYQENRAFTVSNLRFNVRVTYSVKDSALKLLLVPRSVSGVGPSTGVQGRHHGYKRMSSRLQGSGGHAG